VIILKGKADHVSREQVRAFLTASVTVLGYHNRWPRIVPIRVTIVRTLILRGTNGWSGCYDPDDGSICLLASLYHEAMLTTCVHEMIHACIRFPPETTEKCVSTFTAKIKRDVLTIADTLTAGTYKRAAHLAHTRLSYRAQGKDSYDQAQHAHVGVQPYRRGKKTS
jgi:hypothetical protein